MTKKMSAVKPDVKAGKVRPDTYQPKSNVIEDCKLVTKHEAAALLGISPETLKKYRLAEGSTLVEGVHYHTWNSRVIRYNAVLIADWGVNRNDPKAHQRAIEAYQASLLSSQPKRRRRRA